MEFVPVPLSFGNCRSADLFGRKNNKTVRETIQHPKYLGLATQVLANYSGSLEQQLGAFVLGATVASISIVKLGDQPRCQSERGPTNQRTAHGVT